MTSVVWNICCCYLLSPSNLTHSPGDRIPACDRIKLIGTFLVVTFLPYISLQRLKRSTMDRSWQIVSTTPMLDQKLFTHPPGRWCRKTIQDLILVLWLFNTLLARHQREPCCRLPWSVVTLRHVLPRVDVVGIDDNTTFKSMKMRCT